MSEDSQEPREPSADTEDAPDEGRPRTPRIGLVIILALAAAGAGLGIYLWFVQGLSSGLLFTACAVALGAATVGHSRTWHRAMDDALTQAREQEHRADALSGASAEAQAADEQLSAEIERRNRIEEELKEAKRTADAANMAKDEFLATMSHEIRTPLNGILPILDILRSTELDDAQRDYLNTAFQSSKHLLTIIDDILDYSKIEAGRLDLETVGLNLRELVDSVVRLMASTADRKGIRLRVKIDPSVRLAMRGDPVRLKQILTNLVSNAVKFTDRGSVTVTVSRRQDFPRESELLFTVRDTGIGMNKETADRLFRPFAQADASTTRTHGGTGLGLAICKRLAEIMQGRIGVRSEPGRGSVFWFTARLKKSLGDIQAPGRELPGTRVMLATADTKLRDRITVLGDHLELKLVVAQTLRKAAAELERSAGLGSSWRIALVVIDAHLAGEAADLLRSIRRTDTLAELGAVVLTDDGRLPSALADAPLCIGLRRDTNETGLQQALQQLLDGVVPEQGAEIEERELAYEESDSSTLTHPISGQVLLVEDNPVNLHVAQKLLQVAGLRCEVARDGKIALELLQGEAERFDAVLMDCMMPVMDGYTATRNWRSHEAENGLDRKPIIAMTANAMAGDRQKCLDAGMDDYMAKPMNIALLKRTLSRWLPAGRGPSAATTAAPPGSQRSEQESSGASTGSAARPAAHPKTPAVVLEVTVLNELRSLMGSDFESLVEVYLEDSPKALRNLLRAVEAGDTQAMVGPAHSLKSTSANLGALALAELARGMEHDAREGRIDNPSRRLAAMLKLYKRVAAALKETLH